MLFSIIGFLISVFYIAPTFSLSWGFTFSLVFFMMFISSVISMSHIAAESKIDVESLAIHDEIAGKKRKKKPRKKKK